MSGHEASGNLPAIRPDTRPIPVTRTPPATLSQALATKAARERMYADALGGGQGDDDFGDGQTHVYDLTPAQAVEDAREHLDEALAERAYELWAAQRAQQVQRAGQWICDHIGQDQGDVVKAAANILRALPFAPEAEQTIGARLAPPHLVGEHVTCRACDTTWVYDVDPCYDAVGDGDGLCLMCMLKAARSDAARQPDPVIEGVVVTRDGA